MATADKAKQDERAAFIRETMSKMHYDAFVPGETDLQNGLDALVEFQKSSKIPFLAANMLDEKTGQPIFGKSTLVERDGVRIAIVGLIGPSAFAVSPANAGFDPELYKKRMTAYQAKPARLMQKVAELAGEPQGPDTKGKDGKLGKNAKKTQEQIAKLVEAFKQNPENDDDTAAPAGDIPIPEYNGRKFTIADPLQTAEAEYAALRGKADLFILVCHMDRPEMETLRGQVKGYHFLVDGHFDGKSSYSKTATGGPEVIRVGNKGKVLGLVKIHVVDKQYAFEDRSDYNRKKSSLDRYQKRYDEMTKKAGGKDPLQTYAEDSKDYKSAANVKRQIDDLTLQLKDKKPGNYYELERIILDKTAPSDPAIEKRQDEIQPPSERGH